MWTQVFFLHFYNIYRHGLHFSTRHSQLQVFISLCDVHGLSLPPLGSNWSSHTSIVNGDCMLQLLLSHLMSLALVTACGTRHSNESHPTHLNFCLIAMCIHVTLSLSSKPCLKYTVTVLTNALIMHTYHLYINHTKLPEPQVPNLLSPRTSRIKWLHPCLLMGKAIHQLISCFVENCS